MLEIYVDEINFDIVAVKSFVFDCLVAISFVMLLGAFNDRLLRLFGKADPVEPFLVLLSFTFFRYGLADPATGSDSVRPLYQAATA